MANGSFYNYVKGSAENHNRFGLYCEYSYAQSISGNYTDVTVDVWLRYYSVNVNPRNGTITVNGTSKSFTSGTISNYPSGGDGISKLGSQTIRVAHNADGNKTGVNINVVWNAELTYSNVYYRSLSASKTVDLPAIPKSSTIDSLSCNTSYFNGALTYKYTPQSAIYYNRCNISLNVSGTYVSIKSINLGQKPASQQTEKITLSSSELSTIYSKLPNTEKGTLRFTLRTYSDSGYSTQVGEAKYKEITLLIPTSIKPSGITFSLDPVNITTSDGVSRNILVKGKNKIKISINKAAAGTGSSIKSYTFTASDGGVFASQSTTNLETQFGPFNFSGTFHFNVGATDNRGRTGSSESHMCTCYDYEDPYFNSFNIYRADANGDQNDNGTYIKCDYDAVYSSVNSTNSAIVTAYYNGKSQVGSDGSILINLNDDIFTTYQVYLTIVDNYGGSSKTSTVTIFGQSRVFNITSDGTGVAIGKMAESNELFECRWPAKFDGSIVVGSSTQSSTPVDGIGVHDVRNADITPDSFGDKNANFYFDQIDSRWMSILHMKGWTGGYAAWELAGNAHNSSLDNTLKYRQGIGDTWGDWQTIITDKNITSYANVSGYLPLSGGTLTGKLTLANDLYNSSNTAGLDCRNSDIIGANGIFFNDAADSADEGIHFYRSDGYWDTLYAKNGALKFHPNKSASTALGGYTIYNSSNFRRGTCTLSSSSDTTINFTSAFSGTPTVILTPLTDVAGVIPGKVKSVSSTGFTAIIGGSAVSSAKFAYLAIYY